MDIVEIYQMAKEESLRRRRGDPKADLIRRYVKQIALQLNETELLHSAVFKAVKEKFKERNLELQKSYFSQVVSRSFKTVKKDGRLYIVVEE